MCLENPFQHDILEGGVVTHDELSGVVIAAKQYQAGAR